MRDTFRTVGYKSGWVHSCFDRGLKKEVVTAQFADHSIREVSSIHAAKLAITKAEKSL